MRNDRLGVALVAVMVGLSACGDSTAPRETSDESLLASETTTLFDVSAAGTSGNGGCQYADGVFVCRDSRDGLTMTRTIAFFDAAGNAQARFDPVTTASHKATMSVKGTLTLPRGGTATIDRSGSMTVTGLAGNETTHTLNGTEGGTIVHSGITVGGSPMVSTTTVHDTTYNLVVPVGRNLARPWPISGSRVHVSTTAMTSSGGTTVPSLAPMTMRVKETFNGTSVVTIEMTTPMGTRTCTRDLAQPRVAPVCTGP